MAFSSAYLLGGNEPGFIALPLGDGNWFVGQVFASQVSTCMEPGELMSIEISARCIGQPHITDKKPELKGDESVLDLLRQVATKMQTREQQENSQ